MEPENNTPEEQGQDQSSSNTFPGQWSRDKGQKLYNLSQAPKKIKNLKKGAKKMAKKGIKAAQKGVQTAQKTARAAQAAIRAAQVAYTAVTAFLGLGWETILIIIIVVLIIVVLKHVGILGISTYSNPQLTSSGPVFAKIGDKLNYAITINYPASEQNIIITDQLPQGTEYVNAPQATYNPATNTVTWNVTKIIKSTTASPSANINTTLSLTLLATKDNNYIVNLVTGTTPNKVLGESDSLVTPTPFQTTHSEVLGENNSQPLAPRSPAHRDEVGSALNTTPTLFQVEPTRVPISPQDTNIIKSCVVTKVGEPSIVPPLPPECTDF
jgi:uncharacterized repeat protein (TIGR01451 family)